MTRTRVEIPAYTDRWMMGDRMGTIVKVMNRPIHEPNTANCFVLREVAHVKLDISGKTVKVLLDDCTVHS